MNRYPVSWRGRELFVSDLTIGIKEAFCQWLRNSLRTEAMRDLRGRPDVLNPYLDGIKARVWWVAKGMSPAVWESLRSPDGGHQYARLLLGLTEKEMTNAELTEFLDEKEGEQAIADAKLAEQGIEPPYPPANDYILALKVVHEDADPKANGPESGSGPTGMPSSAPS